MRKINVYNDKNLCTEIFYSTPDMPIRVINHTDFLMHRAFGIKTDVVWKDLEDFLEERCFPRTRANCKELLRLMDIPYYDPWLITRKTEGRMAEDNTWLEFIDDHTDR